MQQKILILDFGSQYTQLIARKIRELNVYCEIHPFNHFPTPDDQVKGIILSGSPFSVRDKNAPTVDLSTLRKRYPILGICYGAQLMAQTNGGEVLPSAHREYGRAFLTKVNPIRSSNIYQTKVKYGCHMATPLSDYPRIFSP